VHDAPPRFLLLLPSGYAVGFKNLVAISSAFDRRCYRRLTTAFFWLTAGEREAATSSEGPAATLKFYL